VLTPKIRSSPRTAKVAARQNNTKPASSAEAYLGTKSSTVIRKEPAFVPAVWVDVPQGTYLLKATGVVNRLDRNAGSSLLVRCQFTGGGAVLPFSYFHGPTATPVSAASVEMTGRIELKSAGRIALECTHSDFADTKVEAVRFELLAQRVVVQNGD
jgi:hypothetical protein